jgi:hypothetical protein
MSRLSTSLAGSMSPENRYDAKIPSVAAVDELVIEEYEHDNDVKKLGRIWTRERGTVNIMQWEEDVIDVVLDKLEQQVGGDTNGADDSNNSVRSCEGIQRRPRRSTSSSC